MRNKRKRKTEPRIVPTTIPMTAPRIMGVEVAEEEGMIDVAVDDDGDVDVRV